MAIDATIPLAVQTPQIDVGQIYATALQLKQMQQQLGINNALKATLAQPEALDQKTGLPTANTLAKVMRLDPNTGLKMAAEVSQSQERESQAAYRTSELQKQWTDDARNELGSALSDYDADLSGGGTSPEIAQDKLKGRIRDYIQDSPFDQQTKDRLWKTYGGMTPAQLRNASMTQEMRQKQQEHAEAEADKAKDFAERERHDKAEENIARVRPELAIENRAPTPLKDDDGTDYLAYFGSRGEPPVYTTLQGNPYSPRGATRLSSGAPRSAAAMATQRYLEENPNATAEDLLQFSAKQGAVSKAERDFSTGQQGKAVNSFNVGIAHLNTLDHLVEALGNHDVKGVNRFSQAIKEEFGATAPTNFDAAKAIVGDEIIKAIVGGGGALADRENAQNQLDRAKTPAQLKGVIKTYKELMAGQLRGLSKQYESATGLGNFGEKLLPDTKRELGVGEGHGSGAKRLSAADVERYHSYAPSVRAQIKKDMAAQGYDVSDL